MRDIWRTAPTALIGSLQLRVLGPLKLCVVSGGGQAEKAQKAEAALRAEDGQRCAENGPALVLDHHSQPREHPLAQQ